MSGLSDEEATACNHSGGKQYVSADEIGQLVEQFNNTHAAYPCQHLVHELFEEQVSRAPERIALEFEKQRLTYAQLNWKANQVAHRLRHLGLKPDQRVIHYMQRSVEAVVALLGILKAGGAYVPVDPSYPAQRVAFMLRDISTPIVIAQAQCAAGLPMNVGVVVELDAECREVGSEPGHNLERVILGLSPQNLMYVIYTSGTTGEPKGVMNEHRAVVNRLHWMQQRLALSTEDRVLQKTPLSFDVSVWEVFLPLIAGARLIVAAPAGHQNPEYLHTTIEEAAVTITHFVPSMLRWFLEALPMAACRSLRCLICSGEELSAELMQRCVLALPRVSLWNLYGPTEAAIDVSAWECKDEPGDRVPIGGPIANIRLYILDSQLQELLVGSIGEIYIGGVGLARGYLDRGSLTAARFLADPYGWSPGARMYKTGDLGRWRVDGNIEFIGRNDEQVKIRGFRVELQEIAAHLRQHPAVRDAAVICRKGSGGDSQLLGYVLADVQQLKASGPDPTIRTRKVVEQWSTIYEERYKSGADEPSFVGWLSSYTDQPIPETDMREWLRQTIDRIRSLRPSRVLEIGCGTGLIVEKIAPDCSTYVATDISAEAIQALDRLRTVRTELEHVQLQLASALELQFDAGTFDTVILNSVVQHFPDLDYLQAVLRKVAEWVTHGGQIFIGDVRPLCLLKPFHTSVLIEKLDPRASVDQLKRGVERAIERERDLMVDPPFFEWLAQCLPGVGAVRTLLKRGGTDEEMTRYRYDVIVTKGDRSAVPPMTQMTQISWKDWDGSVAELAAHAQASGHRWIRIWSVPNSRVARDVAAEGRVSQVSGSCTVAELHALLNTQRLEGVDPEKFYREGEAHGYQVLASWQCGEGAGEFTVDWIDAARKGQTVSQGADDLLQKTDEHRPSVTRWANDPWGNALMHQLPLQVRDFLSERLPPYMVPSAVIVLTEWPVTTNGKLDRSGLPQPDNRFQIHRAFVTAATPTERALCDIWQAVLHIEEIGVEDNFFELGGHSILGMELATTAAKLFRAPLPMLAVFQYPTVRAMARMIDAGMT